MRALLLALGMASLAGCSNAAADAERELAIIEKSYGSKDEVCTAKRKVADAYLKAQDAAKYGITNVEASIACQEAQLDH